jgi:hypothetical protein
MASPTIFEQRHFHIAGERSNLDRCDSCGELRSAHGQDWGCPTRSTLGRGPEVALILGSLLTVAGLIMMMTTPSISLVHQQTSALDVILLFGGLLTAVMSATVISRRAAASRPDE